MRLIITIIYTDKTSSLSENDFNNKSYYILPKIAIEPANDRARARVRTKKNCERTDALRLTDVRKTRRRGQNRSAADVCVTTNSNGCFETRAWRDERRRRDDASVSAVLAIVVRRRRSAGNY